MNDDSGATGFETFSGAGLHGEALAGLGIEDLAREAARLTDPAVSTDTIHWGRNYLYGAEARIANGPVPVVVKQFSNQGLRRRLDRRLRGSKAARSWRVAKALLAADLATPRPLMWIETTESEGPSFFVAERLRGAVEVRHFFRRLNGEPGGADFPPVDELAFLGRLGRLARRINDAGILYRDLSMGNILAAEAGDGDELELYLVDFNRARTGRHPGTYSRTRDICRLPVLRRDHQDAFLGGYWGCVPRRWSARRLLYCVSVRAYILKHVLKGRLRSLRPRKHARGGSHHPHIPAAAIDAASRDKSVWDPLSDQPHQHATAGEKWRIRLADAPAHIRDLTTVAASAPSTWRRYRELRDARGAAAVAFEGIGLAVRPWPADPQAHLAEIEALGVGPVLLRLHPWESDHREEEALASALADAGHEVSFVIPQNRDLVRDRSRWRAAVEELADRFTPYGRHFQVGQAVNRSKWGLWTYQEYVDLYLEAAEILRRHDGVLVMGPAVIDFEFQALMALVNRDLPALSFDIVAGLLYVDRRGAPENRQLGFDAADKATLLRAIADTGRCSKGRCWITEVNWPLWEGPHSPAGRSVAVGESEQADYLVRYYLLVLGTGLVERVFWWRLVARGYGLVAPSETGGLRRRPAWFAMRTLIDEIEGASLLGILDGPPGTRLYHFRCSEGRETVAGWSISGDAEVRLPRPAVTIIGRDGEVLAAADASDVVLRPSPTYFRLADG